jgi:hypothetical protein
VRSCTNRGAVPPANVQIRYIAPVDFDRIARELMVALRGRRSQVAWSRRLGYRSNVAYAWESGRRSPTGAEMLRAAGRGGGIRLESGGLACGRAGSGRFQNHHCGCRLALHIAGGVAW